MITKEQALEFLYELSQKTEVMLDVSCGEIQFNRVSSDEYLYTTFSEQPIFESTITKCIKETMVAIESMGIERIPVDIDMLEVGQTYEVVYVDDSIDGTEFEDTIVTKFISIEKGKVNDYLKFEGTAECPMGFNITSDYIKEIYKVNQ